MSTAAAPLNLTDIYRPAHFASEISVSVDDVPRQLAHDDANMSPPYQRKSVWTEEQQRLFMGHVLQGGEVMPIVFQRVPDSGKAEVLDGKQRLEAILAWLDGKIDAQLRDGRLVNIASLTMGKRAPVGLMRISLRFRYINLPFEERKRFYVDLNSGGTQHTKQQLIDALNAKEA